MTNAPAAFTALAIIAQFVAYGPAEELQASGVVLVMSLHKISWISYAYGISRAIACNIHNIS